MWAIKFDGDLFLTFGNFRTPEIAIWWAKSECDGTPWSVVQISA